jgi:hypothetical protein
MSTRWRGSTPLPDAAAAEKGEAGADRSKGGSSPVDAVRTS